MVVVRRRQSRLKKGFLIAMVLFAAVGASFFTYQNRKPSPSSTEDANPINYNPATELEISEAEQNKGRFEEDPDTITASGDKKTVTVNIVDASQYEQAIETRAFVSGVVESGGVCTLTFTKDGSTVTRTVIAEDNVGTTLCPTVTIPRSDFSSTGVWLLKVSYDSNSAEGSTEKNLEIN